MIAYRTSHTCVLLCLADGLVLGHIVFLCVCVAMCVCKCACMRHALYLAGPPMRPFLQHCTCGLSESVTVVEMCLVPVALEELSLAAYRIVTSCYNMYFELFLVTTMCFTTTMWLLPICKASS